MAKPVRKYKTSTSSIKVTGIAELYKTMSGITDSKVHEDILKNVVSTAFSKVLSDAKANAPTDPNSKTDIASDMKMRVSVMQQKEIIEMQKKVRKEIKEATGSTKGSAKATAKFRGRPAGVRATISTGKETEHYALIMEYGADAFLFTRESKLGNTYLVEDLQVDAQPFMRPALYNNLDRIFNTIRTTLRSELQAVFRKNANTNPKEVKQ